MRFASASNSDRAHAEGLPKDSGIGHNVEE